MTLGKKCSGRLQAIKGINYLAIAIEPGGRAKLTAIPDTSPTVEHPTIYLIITVADENTRLPVAADISVDDQTTHGASAEITIAANAPHTITVTADGYQFWESRLETNLRHHKTMNLPILLRPAPDTG